LRFAFFRAAVCWQQYHYNAICDFSRAKGFDPYTYDVSRFLGLPLVEMESCGLRSELSISVEIR
jgi:hypothetical protein